MKQIKAIGWDLDDTLYQRSDFYRAAFETMQKNVIHIHQSFETFYRIFEVHSDIEYEKFIREGKAKEQYQLDRILSTYKYFNCEMSVEQATIFQALNEYYRQHLTLDSEIIHVFEHLQAAGYDLFILTNGPSIDQRNKLNTLQIN
ncbi:HAD hydrolase-like protein [Facklamia tabacinasalis]|uniref:HAD hydrolase-like protein n=1 Tax=Ruoffia tabacinasalis TaxID=87458 RepID=A0ABS0LHK2_9LACT|nr:HAD hydrolase-like protein [Ruoffia tabacinasalis]